MKQPILGIKGKRVVSQALVFALACGTFAVSSQAQVTLTNGNSSAQINPNSQAGMFNWTVGGVNQLNQQWFWYGLGNSAPASINNISAATLSGVTANTMTSTYNGAGFNVGITYTLTGGQNGGGPGTVQSDIGEGIKINNTSASPLIFHFYEYSDFNLQGTPGGETVTLTGTPRGFNDAFQVKGSLALEETTVVPPANHGEAAMIGQTLGELNNGVNPVTLNDVTGAGVGNVTWAFEWDFNIAPGASALISKDKFLEVTPVPEPATMALIALGVAAFAVQRRCQRG